MQRGFSLVELSIVLVILGLLTGGILAGQSLIRASELRSVAADLQRYQAAIHGFRDKYMALPGDMRNAVRFWGAQVGATTDGVDATCGALPYTSPATGVATCNGNGDGIIQNNSTVGASNQEQHRAWQHLANAGLIEGSYTGVSPDADGDTVRWGWNAPASKISSGGYSFRHGGEFDAANGMVLIFGHSNSDGRAGILKPEEAWNLDTKMDDGLPATRLLTSSTLTSPYAPNCCTSDTASAARYDLVQTATNCPLLLRIQ